MRNIKHWTVSIIPTKNSDTRIVKEGWIISQISTNMKKGTRINTSSGSGGTAAL